MVKVFATGELGEGKGCDFIFILIHFVSFEASFGFFSSLVCVSKGLQIGWTTSYWLPLHKLRLCSSMLDFMNRYANVWCKILLLWHLHCSVCTLSAPNFLPHFFSSFFVYRKKWIDSSTFLWYGWLQNSTDTFNEKWIKKRLFIFVYRFLGNKAIIVYEAISVHCRGPTLCQTARRRSNLLACHCHIQIDLPLTLHCNPDSFLPCFFLSLLSLFFILQTCNLPHNIRISNDFCVFFFGMDYIRSSLV